jgi:16S rRNA processing protein RimM
LPARDRRLNPDEPRVVLGQIAGAHGLRGEVRVRYYGDGPENLARVPEVWLASGDADPVPRKRAVRRTGSGRSGEIRLALEGVGDRDAAAALRGQLVLADPELLEALPEGEFYWHELIGCEVFDREGTSIGVVRELQETGAHDLLVVETASGERHLLSTARELMPEIDPEARRIVVEVLPGMLDAPIART